MNVKKSLPIFVMGLLMPGLATAGHHEKSEGVALAAQPGQVMIVYHWPCADADRGLALLKEMIAYESKAAPYPYSAAPAIHEDGALVSVDVHSSADSMEKVPPGKLTTKLGKHNLPKWKQPAAPPMTSV